MKKKLTTLLFCLVITVLCVSHAFAAAPTAYSDVPEGHPYAQAINYLTAQGYMNGTGSGRFGPEQLMSFEEYTALLMRAFYPDWPCENPNSADWSRTYMATAPQIGIYTSKDVEYYSTHGLTRELVWRTSAEASSLNPYPAWCYTGDRPELDFDADIRLALQMTGIFPELGSPDGAPTRGEVAHLFYCLLARDYIPQPEPEQVLAFPMDIKAEGLWKLRNSALYDLTFIPQKYLDAFQEDGWRLLLVNNMKPYYDTKLAYGLTVYNDKQIILSKLFYPYQMQPLVHEFGHYAMWLSGDLLSPGYMYDFEAEALASLTDSRYCCTNKWEYFAEAFSYILLNRDNPEKYAEMQEQIPLSLRYIEEGWLDAGGPFDRDAINRVTQETWDDYRG